MNVYFVMFNIFRNLVYSPSESNIFGGASFAGIYDSYKKYTNSDSSDADSSKLKAEVERQISLVILAVQSAERIIVSEIIS